MDDVLIVGAGPAGATAARALALGGARVRVVDRAAFPRNKPCGGAISARVRARFPWIDQALDAIPVHGVSVLHLEGPSGGAMRVRSASPAVLMVRRVEFDRALLRVAQQAGAELVERVEIAQVEERGDSVAVRSRDGRRWQARHLVAADGVYSVVARRLGLNPGWPAVGLALDMMEETPADRLRAIDPSVMWVSYGHGGRPGYAYTFPKVDHVNAGIGYRLDHFRRHVARQPYAVQSALVSQLRRLGVLAGESSRAHFTPFQLPVGGPLRRTAGRRVLLAGDAGGFVNGITAEGIYYAMVTGELAARALLNGGPAAYPALWRREIGVELRDAVLVQRYLLSRPERIDRAIAAGSRSAFTDLIVGYGAGHAPYRTVRRALLRRSPLLWPKLAAVAIGEWVGVGGVRD